MLLKMEQIVSKTTDELLADQVQLNYELKIKLKRQEIMKKPFPHEYFSKEMLETYPYHSTPEGPKVGMIGNFNNLKK